MKRFLLTLLLIIGIYSSLNAHKADKYYWIEFTDKENTNFNLSNPSIFLSQKAIDRRQKQNIPLDITDLPINNLYIQKIKSYGVNVKNTIKWLNGIIVTTTDETIIEEISFEPFVKNIIKYSIEKSVKKNKFEKSYDNTNSENYPSLIHNGQLIHEKGYTGKDVTITIIDAGFYKVDKLPAFESAIKENRIIATYDFVRNKTDVYSEDTHGMQVLSLIAANKPDILRGSAPDANFVLLRSEDKFTETPIEELYWVDAAEFADSIGTDIISSSLGYSTFDNERGNHFYNELNGKTTIISKAAELASKKGILVVVSAGNEGNDEWGYITPPADAAGILTVGSIDKDLTISPFSSYGPTYDGRVKPDVLSIGSNVKVQNYNGTLTSSSGTSFSTPTIAGLAACLWQANPNLSNTELIKTIIESSCHYQKPGKQFGYGIPNFIRALQTLTEVNKLDISKTFITTPNPFTNNIDIELSEPTKIRMVTIVNINGKKIIEINYYNTEMKNIYLTNLGQLTKGIYIVVILTDDGILSKKLVK